MIEQEKCKAVYLLHQEGINICDISRQLHIAPKTVRKIIKQKGVIPEIVRNDKITIDSELLERLYQECSGYVQRIYEKLTEEEHIKVGYSTLTRMLRKFGYGTSKKIRCSKVNDEPGAEMQHDTSDYRIMIGDKKMKVIASMLYYRYSKQRYLVFYCGFNRFKMKCFFHEALMHYGYSAPICIIDNTNLARLRGTGHNAVIVPEMLDFAKQYGFKFKCHEIGHTNRKAGNERGFYTVETSFFPGRKFANMNDLNRQAIQWATIRKANQPIHKSKLIPAKAFEYEKSFLNKISLYISAPYLPLNRDIDQYGYISYDGNFYWVPGEQRGSVKVLQYSKSIKIYLLHELLAEYPLPDQFIKNEIFSPNGVTLPRYKPHNRKKATAAEEKKLRDISKEADEYLTFVIKNMGKEKHRFIRTLFKWSCQWSNEIFSKALSRALKYRITKLDTIDNILRLLIKDSVYEIPIVEIDEELQQRPNFQEGYITQQPDLLIYDKLQEDNL